jgi:class 3 adenylate cyclase
LRNESKGRQRILFALLVICVAGLQLGYLFNMVAWRSEPDRGWYLVTDLGPHIVAATRPPGEAAGLRRGDRILTINGRTYADIRELWQVLDPRIGSTNVYEIERGGQTFTIPVTTEPLGLMAVFRLSGLYWALGTLFCALGVLVFLMKPHDPSSRAFFAMVSLLGITITYTYPSSRNFHPPELQSALAFAIYPLPAALIHLATVFPRRWRFLQGRGPWLVAPLYLAGFGLAILACLESRDLKEVSGWRESIRYVALFAALSVFMISTLVAYLRSTSATSRLQALVIFTGTLIALFAPLLDRVYAFAVGQVLIPNMLLFSLISATLFPLSIAYAIVQHDLFEIDTIVRRTYGYLLSTAAVVTLYGLTVTLLNVTIGPSGLVQSPFFTIAFVLAMVFVMQPIHARIQRFVDRVFYRQQYDYRKTITDVSEKMTSMLDPRLVKSTLVDAVTEEMFLENGRLLLPGEAGHGLEVSAAAGNEWPAARSRGLELAGALRHALEERRVPVFRHEIELDPAYARDRESMLASFDEMEAELMLPLVFEGTTQGVLSLGRKKSGKMFTREDVDLLRTLINQSVVALENARLFKEVADHLKHIQMLENVKSNLAKFVPQRVQELAEESGDGEDLFAKREEDVTVLFADITGYTRLSSQVPLEEVTAIVERYFSAFMEEIQSHGGDLNSTEGDGMMAIFRDDERAAHARAAVRTALAMQRRTQELNAERSAAVPIGIHIGVNSGTASLGAQKIEAGAGSYWVYNATGPTTNLAARLCGFGEEVAVSEETWGRLDEHFVTEDLGLQSFKNVEQPVGVHRVTDERPRAREHPVAEPVRREPVAAASSNPGQFTILGMLRESESGRALSNLIVRAFDKDLVVDDSLGDAITDESGRFEIRFTDEFFGDLFEQHPDIYLRIVEPAGGREVLTTRETIRWNAGALETFDLAIPREKLERPADERHN